jgi:hypothetical protein
MIITAYHWLWLLLICSFPAILGIAGGLSEYKDKRTIRKEVRNCLD